MACEDARDNQQNNGKKRRKGILYEWGGLLFWLGLFLFCLLLRAFVNGDLRVGPETIGDMIARKDIYAGVVGVECSSYTQYSYDDQGRQTEVLVYTRDNKDPKEWSVHTREIWEYDNQGRVILYERYLPYQDNILDMKEVYEYSNEGYKMTRSYTTRSYSARSGDDVFLYDTEGKRIWCALDSWPGIYQEYTYAYDDQGRKISEMEKYKGFDIVYDNELQDHVKKDILWEGVVREIQWNDEDHTSVEKHYNSVGGLLGFWFDTYDEEWKLTGSVWCDGNDLPRGETDYLTYCTQGRWVDYRDGLPVQECFNEKDRDSGTVWFYYHVYDYDENGNQTLYLSATDYTLALDRYVYDKQGRLTEQFSYGRIKVPEWEMTLSDGSSVRIERDEELDDFISIAHIAADGSTNTLFMFDERGHIDTQYSSEATSVQQVYSLERTADGLLESSWKKSVLELAEEQGEDAGELVSGWACAHESDNNSENQGDNSENEQEADGQEDYESQRELGEIWEPEEYGSFYYMVQPGDNLWSIAERYLGSGAEFFRIYEENRDVVGEYPGRILPGMRLYIPEGNRKLTDEEKLKYLSAYREIIEQLEAENPGKRDYDLIYMDEDAVPELVADVRGYYVSVYTYDAGQVFLVMDDWGYGAFGIAGYEYMPRQNIIHCCDVDGAGLVLNFFYGRINEIHEYEDFRFVWCETGDYESDEWSYYNEYSEITEEEFDSLLIDGEFTYIEGIYPGREMLEGIRQEIERLEGR